MQPSKSDPMKEGRRILKEAIKATQKKNVTKLDALERFHSKIDNEKDIPDILARKRKGRNRAILTEDEIRDDLDIIAARIEEGNKLRSKNGISFGDDVYQKGDVVAISLLNEEVVGEIYRIGDNQIIVQLKNKDTVRVSESDVKSGKVKIQLR